MVVPFMSIYFKKELAFTWFELTTVMTLWGIGSMIGSFMGGWLTDKVGQFKVQFYSLLIGGTGLIGLSFLTTFAPICGGVFITSIILEALRPANAASVILYTTNPENISRSFSLNRMAINLGYTISPILGGVISSISFHWLFIIDGITCIAAGIYFFIVFRNTTEHQNHEPQQPPLKQKNPYYNLSFCLFVFFVMCFATVFFQIFTTLPLYYKDVYHLHESEIGFIIGLNGLIVFFFEMIIVSLIGTKIKLSLLVIIGSVLNGVSFLMLTLFTGKPILYISNFIISFAEIFAFPFMLTYVTHHSNHQNRGTSMGLYSLAFAVAYILSPLIGNTIIVYYGFHTLWYASFILSLIICLGFLWTMEKNNLFVWKFNK